MPSIHVTNIGKRFGSAVVFRKISFTIKQGEVLAITGWNGSGKSTLLRILAGLEKPSAGEIEFTVDQQPVPILEKRKMMGMVAPVLSIYDELTAMENIEFFNKVRGTCCTPNSVKNILELMDLTSHQHKICKKYSSGMKQRLKLAIAIIHHPKFLLLDEPGSNLDSRGRQLVKKVVKEQKARGITIIASNEQEEVDYGDRIINLSE